MERRLGYQIFRSANFYKYAQRLISRKSKNETLFGSAIKKLLNGPVSVLDLGCGPATFYSNFRHLAAFRYVGIDINCSQIEQARIWYPDIDLRCNEPRQALKADERFELVLSGILHHLSDNDSIDLLETVHHHLAPGGLFVSVETFIASHKFSVANFIARADRGRHVRTVAEYKKLLYSVFDETEVSFHVVSGQLRIPYHHLVIEVTKH